MHPIFSAVTGGNGIPTTLVLAEGMYYNVRRPWALGSKEILAYGKWIK